MPTQSTLPCDAYISICNCTKQFIKILNSTDCQVDVRNLSLLDTVLFEKSINNNNNKYIFIYVCISMSLGDIGINTSIRS